MTQFQKEVNNGNRSGFVEREDQVQTIDSIRIGMETVEMENNAFNKINDIGQSIVESLIPLYEIGNYLGNLLKKSEEWYNIVFKPLQDFSKSIQEKFASISSVLSVAFRPLLVADELGKHQYVIWEYLTPEFVNSFYQCPNIDKELRLMYEKNNYKLFYSLSQECINCLEGNNARVLSQAIDSFSIKNYDLCAIGITVVIDGELSVVTGNPCTNINHRVELLFQKLDNDEVLSEDEYSLCSLYLTVDATMRTFAASLAFGKEREPSYINRHWTMHGRTERRKTKMDCVKLLRFLYAIILLDKIEKEDIEDC